ncbi:hypothetical protein ANTRET_LOCUS6708, partial [Anthophora retusa]
MPSFLGRVLGLSFRTERLMMNIVGLINSTLDWSSLKWTNKLEQIWNLSLSQRTLILDTIGEDTIKTVLSWIVITRIVIAHVYTFTYVTNIYPILTWSRPNLLLPWLILSFFKNVVLEVIVIAVGLLLWYDKRFSLAIFLEFVLMKVVPLIFASYNWYSNSCLFLELRQTEKLRKLRKNLRSDTNLIATRLYVKIADSKYRTRSLTTLISWESYDTYDTNDTISRILDDPTLPPSQKTMRILGINEQDIIDARNRIRERAMHRRLTEEEDAWFKKSTRDVSRYLSIIGTYDSTMREILEIKLKAAKTEDLEDVITEAEVLQNEILKDEVLKDFILNEMASSEIHNDSLAVNNPSVSSIKNEPSTSKEDIQSNNSKKRRGTEITEVKRTKKQMKMGPVESKNVVNTNTSQKEQNTEHNCEEETRKSMERSCSPVKLQSFFNCNCLVDEYMHKEEKKDCLRNSMKTSTPNGSPSKEKIEKIVEIDCDTSEHPVEQFSTENENTENSDSLLMLEKLLKNVINEQKTVEENDPTAGNVSIQEISEVPEEFPCVQNISDVKQGLKLSSNLEKTFERLTVVESEAVRIKMTIEKDVLNTMVSMKSVSGINSCAQEVERNALPINLPQYSFGDTNIPRFYKDSMKIFDGCYEQDFANNSELQCLLQQLEKKKWSIFPGQLSHDTAMKHADQTNQLTIQATTTHPVVNNFEKAERYKISTSSSSNINRDHSISETIQENEQHCDDDNSLDRFIKPSQLISKKDKYTETEEEYFSTNPDNLLDRKKRRKRYARYKHLRDPPSTNHSPIRTSHDRRAESRSSISKDRYKLYTRHRSTKTGENQKRASNLSKSSSDKSLCDCMAKQTEGKHSSESKFDKKDEHRRCGGMKSRVNNFGTIPLSQVTRPSIFESATYRRKPPAYPKKLENSSQISVAASRNAKKSSPVKKLLETSKKPTEKQSTSSNDTKKYKWKRGTETLEEQEAREMRALRAINEVTLLKYKKKLEAKRKISSGRNSIDQFPSETSKNLLPVKKSNLDRSKKDNPSNTKLYNYLDKENVSVDATTETEMTLTAVSNENKAFNASGKLFSVSTEKFPCSKLSKVNKVTDKILENFDRLHGGQLKQDTKKNKQTVEGDTRKPYTKYSKPKKQMDEDNPSVVSIKRLEGSQEGRELDRTPGKEDVRVSFGVDDILRSLVTAVTIDHERNIESVEDRKDRVESNVEFVEENVPSTSMDDGKFEDRENSDLTTIIKSTVEQGATSNWSSSTTYQSDELLPVQDVPSARSQIETIQEIEDTKEEETKESTIPIDIVPRSSTLSTTLEEQELSLVPFRNDQIHLTPSTNFTRNVEISYTANGVILSNSSVPRSKARRTYEIVDDETIRMLHRAFSYRITDTIFDPFSEIRLMIDILTERSLRPSDDNFLYQLITETLDLSMDDHFSLFTEENSSSEQTLIAMIRQFQSFDEFIHEDDSFDLFIAPAEPITLEIDAGEQQSNDEEELQQLSINEIVSNDVLWHISRNLRNMCEFNLGNIPNLSRDTLQSPLSNDDTVIVEETSQRNEEEPRKEEEPSKEDEELPKIVEEELSREFNMENILNLSPDTLQTSLSNDDKVTVEENEEKNVEENQEEEEERSTENEDLLKIIKKEISCKFNVESIPNFTPDLLNNPLNNDDKVKVDEEKNKEGESSIEVEKLLKIVKGEILTNVKLFDSVPDVSNEDTEEFHLTMDRIDENKVNLFSITEETNEKEEKKESTRKFEIDEDNLLNSWSSSEEGIILYLETKKDDENNVPKKDLNKTYDLLRDIDEILEEMNVKEEMKENIEFETIEEISKKEDVYETSEVSITLNEMIEECVKVVEMDENTSSARTEELESNIQSIDFENEENEEAQVFEHEEDTLDVPENNPTSSIDVDEAMRLEELREEMSLKMIFMFWIFVFYFYVKYFYQQIFSYGQVSQFTPTLKPFEIHTVPTSTTTLFEKSKLLRRNENFNEYEENEEENNDTFDEVMETADVSGSSEYYTPLLDTTGYKTCSNSFNVDDEDRSKTDEEEVARTVLQLREEVSENVTIIPFFASKQIVLKEEEEIRSRNFRLDRDFGTPLISSMKCPITSNRQFHNIHKPEITTDTDKSSLILEQEEKTLLVLESGEEEIEDSGSSLLNIDDQTKSIEELDSSSKISREDAGGPSVEEVQREVHSETRRKSYVSVHEEEKYESKEKEETFSEENVKEEEESYKMNMEMTDSFDSTYTRASETSKRSTAVGDLNESSMEEFSSNGSNENS